MTNLESINTFTTNSQESIITDETLHALILNANISICNNKIRPDLNSFSDCINRELRNSDIAHTWVKTRLSFLIVNEKSDTKYPSRIKHLTGLELNLSKIYLHDLFIF